MPSPKQERAESGVKRNIPGRCGKAPAVNGDPGWGDGGRDASGAGGTGAAGRAQGRGAIARALGRAAPTVSRALRRNALPRGGSLPVHAEGCYRERRQRQAVLERDERLGRFVRERLLEGWTPEQIAGRLERGEGRGPRPVSLETIHAFVHRPGQRGEKLWQLLPRGRARRGGGGARAP